jgi:hypothetical protein
MKDSDSIYKIAGYVISLIPLLLTFLHNFKKEEASIANNKKNLLNQIRVVLSTDYANSIVFEENITEIDDDFYSKLQNKFNELLYSQTNKFFDFYNAIHLGSLAIKWIRYLKNLLIYASIITIIVFSAVLILQKGDINILCWVIYFVAVTVLILITLKIKEDFVDSFNDLLNKYEIERKE